MTLSYFCNQKIDQQIDRSFPRFPWVPPRPSPKKMSLMDRAWHLVHREEITDLAVVKLDCPWYCREVCAVPIFQPLVYSSFKNPIINQLDYKPLHNQSHAEPNGWANQCVAQPYYFILLHDNFTTHASLGIFFKSSRSTGASRWPAWLCCRRRHSARRDGCLTEMGLDEYV